MKTKKYKWSMTCTCRKQQLDSYFSVCAKNQNESKIQMYKMDQRTQYNTLNFQTMYEAGLLGHW
jgi:hypothetical protein